jgi:catechol 2,3-dioxygenase-like lactoylglutathione lyase family enzyme
MPTLDHVTLSVSDYARSKAFYEKALAPLRRADSVATESPTSG